MNSSKFYSQVSEKGFQILQKNKNENDWEIEQMLNDLEEKYGSVVNVEDLIPVDELLAMFDDNGERITERAAENTNFSELFEFLEAKYGFEDLTVNYQTVEELLDKFGDDGQPLEGDVEHVDELGNRDEDNLAGHAWAHNDSYNLEHVENAVGMTPRRKRKRLGKRGGRRKKNSFIRQHMRSLSDLTFDI